MNKKLISKKYFELTRDQKIDWLRLIRSENIGPTTFHGEHYRLEGAVCQPKPLQRPHIPIWVAGGGEKLTLRVAARFADFTSFRCKLRTGQRIAKEVSSIPE